eukprot:gene25996-34596_t
MEEWFSSVFHADSPIKSMSSTMVVGFNIKVKGDVRFADPFDTLILNGHIEGRIIAPSNGKGRIVINDSGTYRGDIVGALVVAINGRVIGDLCVDTLYLARSAMVHGNIMCRSLKMDRSAVLVGQLSVSKELDVGIDAYKAEAANTVKDIDNVEENDTEREHSTKKRTPKGKVVLLVLLPQVDYFSEYSDLGDSKFCEFLKKNTNSVDSIYITLDSHHKMHIGHRMFWTGNGGASPDIHAKISRQQVLDNIWKPKMDNMQEYCMEVFDAKLQRQKERAQDVHVDEDSVFVCIHEEHCLIGTQGAAIIPALSKTFNLWVESRAKDITYIQRGDFFSGTVFSDGGDKSPGKAARYSMLEEKDRENSSNTNKHPSFDWDTQFLSSLQKDDTGSTACSDSSISEIVALLTRSGSNSDEMPRVCVLTDALRFDPSEEYVDGILDSLQQMGAELCTTIDIVLE